ncbi:unnamed protein product [Orchesella dallaii]|uniref:NADH dehydrogenase [ubiquinone] 1 alpha subcomplex subunit 2 n=1 Tax=Orchesella dallaii TaxID=48710 RepID=A0ABP1PQY1_9HEXA
MAARFGSAVRELRIHLCQKSPASKGVREWVEKHYVDTKKANPQFPILIRECSNVTPKVYARYALGKENSAVLSDKSAADVGRTIEMLAKQ